MWAPLWHCCGPLSGVIRGSKRWGIRGYRLTKVPEEEVSRLVVIPCLCVFEDLLGQTNVAGISLDSLCGFADVCLFLVSVVPAVGHGCLTCLYEILAPWRILDETTLSGFGDGIKT